jgi:hypothetical protein
MRAMSEFEGLVWVVRLLLDKDEAWLACFAPLVLLVYKLFWAGAACRRQRSRSTTQGNASRMKRAARSGLRPRSRSELDGRRPRRRRSGH